LPDWQANKRALSGILTIAFVAILSGDPSFGQTRRQPAPNMRRSLSFPDSPAPANSFYPVIRNSQASNRNTQARKPGWVNLGNGARMRVAQNSIREKSELSPDVLETLKSLQQKEPEPAYQLSPAGSPSPITGVMSQSLEAPEETQNSQQEEIGALESRINFPPEKNIRLQALDFRNTPVPDALRSLAQLIQINLMLSPGVTGNVTILFSDVSIEEAFNTILSSYDLSFIWEGNILRIFPSSEAPMRTKIFPIQHTNATDIKTIVDRMLTTGRGSSEIDPRTNSLMVTDTTTKLAEVRSLLPKIDVKESSVDISSRPLTEVFYLDYADATTLRAPIEMLSQGVQIQEFSSSSASQAGAAGGEGGGGRMDMMIITDTQNNLQRIRELLEKLDVPPIQVTIDAHIYEIDKNEEERLGINWQKSIPISGTGENLFEMTIAPEDANAGGTGVFRFGSLDINQFTALLAMLKTHSFAKVLSNPVITTLNNRQANITVGQSIPYVSASQVNAETGQVTNTIAQANANIALVVTPSVTGNDEIFLDIQPTISSVLGFTELGGNSTPNLSTRSAVTQVICKDNHTIVIGGMIKTDKSDTVSKVPFLGDLPGIGKFFQRRSQRETRTELIIFITPHIVSRDSNKKKQQAEATTDFIAPRLTLQP
jgi:type II secretory pathway component GspD/PulD (secretin)